MALLTGTAGDDTLVGTSGDDVFDGGAGSDTADYSLSTGPISVNLTLAGQQNTVGAGLDTLISIENLIGSAYNDTITLDGVVAPRLIDGGAGSDRLIVNGNAVFGLNSLAGIEHIEVNGTASFDSSQVNAGLVSNLGVHGAGHIYVNSTTSVQTDLSGWTFTNGSSAVDWSGTIEIDGTSASDTIVGSSQRDVIWGGDSDDSLFGGDGDDEISGGAGVDQVYGDAGNDVLRFAEEDVAPLGDRLDGGIGTDTLWTSGSINFTGVILTSLEKLVIGDFGDPAASHDLVFIANQVDVGSTALSSTLAVTSSYVDDTITIQGKAGTTVNLSGWTFANWTNWNYWSGGDQIVFDGSNGADTVYGSSQNDALHGGDGDDIIHGGDGDDAITGDGGTDQIFGDAGNDALSISQDDWATGETLDGGTGTDTLFTYGAIDFTGSHLAGLELITMNFMGWHDMPSSLSLTFTADQVATQLPAGLQVTGSYLDDNIADSIVINGQAATGVDLSGWSFSEWAANDVVTVNGSANADTVTLNSLSGNYLVNFGGGADTLALAATAGQFRADSAITVADFQAGAGGDRLELSAWLDSALQAYTPGADPFADGHLQLLQSGADTLVQVDRNGGGDSFSTLLTLKNTDAHALTAANLDGFSPTVRVPAEVHGGAGLDTTSYAGLSRAYSVSAHDGEATVSGSGVFDHLTGIERIAFADGYFATGTGDTAAQVYRVYEAALGRDPDAAGLTGWVHALEGGASLQTLADGFLGSQEFTARFGTGDDAQFLTLLYNNVLGRAPDTEGLQAWRDLLDHGTTRAQVVIGFSEGKEFINATAPEVEHGLWVGDTSAAQVARLYDTVFGRLPDASGEIGWTAALHNGTSLTQVADGFVASHEFQGTYGALADDAFIQLMYQNVLHRAADTDGLNGWIATLAAGESRAEVVVGFSESQEHVRNTAAHIDDGVWFG